MVSNCIVHHLSFLRFYFSLFAVLFSTTTIVTLVFYYCSYYYILLYFILASLSQPMILPFISSPSIPPGGGEERANDCVVLRCWLELNHNTLLEYKTQNSDNVTSVNQAKFHLESKYKHKVLLQYTNHSYSQTS